ncbi:MAG: glycoside-pentoside-hexuronide (GPH):cation symporter, partial [Clostridiales bacterium]|nr:glycoside-pentoside-hexuronide (GPH):cation symporter [Clostridiales bacterium]
MKSSVSEKITYGLGGVGYQMTLALTNAFLVLYYTDSVMISASFVGTMMLVARLMDGASDIAMGIIIEKTKTRFGKARPWLLFGSLPLAISIMLLFNVPAGLPELSQKAYVFITYIFMSVICYTIVALAHSSMLPRISLVSDDRNIITVVLALMQGIMTALMVGVFAPLLEALGGESSQQAWTSLAAIVSVASLLLLLVCFAVTKEKLSVEEKPEKASDGDQAKPQAKTPIKEALAFLLKSRYFYIIVVLYMTMAITNGTAGIGIYYMRDILGDANLMGIFSILVVIPMILVMPFVPKLFSLFGKRRTLICSLGVGILLKIVMLFFPANVAVQMVCTFAGTVIVVPLWVATPTMVCDLVDYGGYRCGIHIEGLATSASSFGTKLGTGLGSVMLGAGLTIGGYNALSTVQSDAAKSAIIFIMVGIPAIMFVICFTLICLWNLEKY